MTLKYFLLMYKLFFLLSILFLLPNQKLRLRRKYNKHIYSKSLNFLKLQNFPPVEGKSPM